VLRTALRPRWVALLVVVLLAATGMAWLGQWQLDRAREHGRKPAERAARAEQTAAPRPIEQVIQARQTFPKDAVNARVSVTGRWDPTHRLLITGRKLNGHNGFWVLVPLRLADGSAVPVVQGWVASTTDPAAAGPITASGSTGTASSTTSSSAGTVEVIGLLQPSEPAEDLSPGSSSGLAADELDRIAASDLVNRWPYPLITGFVVEQKQTPAAGSAPSLVPPPTPDTSLDLVNVSYAIQWWLFALLGIFFWFRLVRDDHQGLLADPAAPTAPDPTRADRPTADVSTVAASSGNRDHSPFREADDVRGRQP
jgi:cytochrome oxidase assembly protein ShyY1